LNDSSVFELASVSKQFTAMGIMILKDRKLLSYENNIKKYFPQLPYDNITIRNLLTHTSGITSYEDQFEKNWANAGKSDWLALIPDVLPGHVRAAFVTQAEALGLGHAVLCAKPVVGNEPFAVLLADDLIWNKGHGALRQMADCAERENASVIAVQDVPREQTGSYGIVATENFNDRQGVISAIVEKPKPEVAPSNLAVVGRYVLSGRIFDLLEKTKPGAGGEIQLTDAIAALLKEEKALAYRFEGRRFDCGSRIGLIEATIQYALDHDDLADAAREYMTQALKNS